MCNIFLITGAVHFQIFIITSLLKIIQEIYFHFSQSLDIHLLDGRLLRDRQIPEFNFTFVFFHLTNHSISNFGAEELLRQRHLLPHLISRSEFHLSWLDRLLLIIQEICAIATTNNAIRFVIGRVTDY